MLNSDNKFFDHFQFKGQWWLPETPDLVVFGVLTHSEDETTLDLFGTLREEDFRTKGVLKMPQPTPVIYGILESGIACTLHKNSSLNERMQLFGKTTSSKWGSRVLFLGAHIPDPNKFDFADWNVAYTGLEEWMGDCPFPPFDEKREDDKLVEVSSRYVVPQKFSVVIKSLKATLESDFSLNSNGNVYRSRNWEHTAYLVLRPESPKGFEWYMESFRDVQNFLLLCIGEPIYPKSIVAHTVQQPEDGEFPPKDIHVYYHISHRKERESRHSAEMLMPLRILRHMLSEMINNWFEKADKLRDVYNLFFGTFYNSSLYLESAFLSLIQAIETYSRSVRESQYVTQEEYSKIADVLKAAIPAGTPSDLKESLKSRIKYGNEHSLRKRLAAILNSLDPETTKLFCDDPARFRNRIVDTRNYLTHYTDELRENAITGTDLHIANLRMQVLLIILLCKELGVFENSIRETLKNNPKWLQIICLHLEKSS